MNKPASVNTDYNRGPEGKTNERRGVVYHHM